MGRKIGVEELELNTGLTQKQVYEGLRNLKRRGLIKKIREIGKAGYKEPPKGKIYVEINEKSLKRIKEIIKWQKT